MPLKSSKLFRGRYGPFGKWWVKSELFVGRSIVAGSRSCFQPPTILQRKPCYYPSIVLLRTISTGRNYPRELSLFQHWCQRRNIIKIGYINFKMMKKQFVIAVSDTDQLDLLVGPGNVPYGIFEIILDKLKNLPQQL